MRIGQSWDGALFSTIQSHNLNINRTDENPYDEEKAERETDWYLSKASIS
jgi:hypothetical protein